MIKKGLPVGAPGRTNKLKPVVFMEEACLEAEVRGKPRWEVIIYNLEAPRRDDSVAVKVWQCLKTSEACHSYCVQIFVCLCGQDSFRAAKSSVPLSVPKQTLTNLILLQHQNAKDSSKLRLVCTKQQHCRQFHNYKSLG